MSITKNALLRYQTLDRCFKNSGRSYLIEDLLDEINQALTDENPDNSGIQIRQLREDIRFMRSELGYSAPIDSKEVSGKKHAYFCSDLSFLINNDPLNKLLHTLGQTFNKTKYQYIKILNDYSH